jgi:hypothetical protein
MEKHMALLAEHPNVATNAPKVAGGRCSAGDAQPTTNPTMGARERWSDSLGKKGPEKDPTRGRKGDDAQTISCGALIRSNGPD